MDHQSYLFCPRITCPNHRLDAGSSTHWYTPFATYSTKAFGTVQRYRCRHCNKTFSDQTFSLNYYLKKKTDFRAFAKALNSRSSDLFCARHFGYSSASIQTRVDRLARNALYLHAAVAGDIRLSEHVVADGLESYTGSKFFPNNINILVGNKSEYLYDFNLSHAKRKGRMSDEQRRRSEGIYEGKSFITNELSTRFSQLLSRVSTLMVNREIDEVQLHTDENPVYRSVFTTQGIDHLEHMQTNSQERRDQNNPLFAVNYFERLMRKDMVNHRRKSICFARDDQNMMSRFAWYMCAHNYFKPKRIKSRARQVEYKHCTPVVGESEVLKKWKGMIYEKRFLLSFSRLSGFQRDVWMKRVDSPLGKRGKWNYLPQFAMG